MLESSFLLQAARIRTSDPSRPHATVMAVVDGRIADIGDQEVAQRWSARLPAMDVGGATVLPGFVDVHNHHAMAGRADLFELILSPDARYESILAEVARYAAGLGPGDWVVGGSWSSTLIEHLSGRDAASELDLASGGRPVVLVDDSHHNRWASTAALRLAGIGRDSVDPEGGRVVRNPFGRPSGLLFEAAGLPIETALQKNRTLSSAQHEAASARGVSLLHRYGVTAFQDAGATIEILRALKALDDRGELDAWVVTSMLVNDPILGAEVLGEELFRLAEPLRSEHHRPDFIKIFLDGVPPTRTAAFLHSYLPDDAHGDHHRGAVTMGAAELQGWLLLTARKGLSAKIHCTGDAAVRAALDAIAAVRAEGHSAPLYQIAHGQFVDSADIDRFSELDVSADISPYLWTPGVIPDAIATVLPMPFAAQLQPNRSLLDAGATIGVGSDWPVSDSPNPLDAVQGLVTRADPSGARSGTLWPEQAITLDEALAAVTLGAARAMGLDEQAGSLTAGKSADFLVLDGVLDEGATHRIASTGVGQTWFAGRQVFRA